MKQLSKLVLLLMCLSVTSIILATPPNPPAGFKWEVVDALTDEFNGNSLDTNKWFGYNPDWVGRPPGMFKEAQVSVSEGFLRLKNKKVASKNRRVWVNTGCVVSKKFIYARGMYSECRLKAAKDGTVTGFWFSKPNHAEIDVQEAVGFPANGNNNLTTKQRMNTHYIPRGYKYDEHVGANRNVTHVGDNFHVYGAWWKDSRNVYFYNEGNKNTPVAKVKTKGPFTKGLRLRMNTETQNWIGDPAVKRLKNNKLNTTLIDYVRTWKLVPVSGGKN